MGDRLNVNAYGATGTPMSPAMAAAAAAAGVGVAGVGVANHTSAAGGAGTSVLKSVDEILRSNGASHLHVPSSSVHGVIGSSDHLYNNHVSNQFGIGSSTSAMANNLTGIGNYGAGGLSSSIGVSGVPISHI